MSERARIVLADDHPIVLAGLRNLIQATNDLELVGEATTGLAALDLISEKRPDVAVLDVSMPQLNGIVLARRLALECPMVRILMLSLHEDRAYVKQAMEAGARGYVLKRAVTENLLSAIRTVLAGALYLDPAVANGMISNPNPTSAEQPSTTAGMRDLSERETMVLKLAALGYTNKETASRIDVGVKSVETYRLRATEKLGLKTRADIVRYAAMQGWLENA